MIIEVLLVVLVLFAVAGGFAFHPLLFLLAVLLIVVLVGGRYRRVP